MGIRKRTDTKSEKWVVDYTNPFSRERRYLTVSTKEEAEKQDALLKYRLKYERDTFREEAKGHEPKEDKPDSCLETIDYLYLREKRFGVKRMRWHLDGMSIPLEMIGRKDVTDITDKDLSSVMARQSMKDVKPITVRNRMKVLYTVIRWAFKRGFIAVMPRLPDLPEARYEKFIPPTEAEANELFAVAPDHIRRVIVLGAKLGVRVGPSEMFRITWDDIDLERCVVRVPAAMKNKSEPWREVPIKKKLLPLFRYWKEQDERSGDRYLIHYAGKPITALRSAWKSCLQRAGIKRRIRPYDLRHAFATDAIAAGADVGTISKLMGHTSPTMVLSHYQHVLTRQKIESVESLPDIDFGFLAPENATAKMLQSEKRSPWIQ